MMFPWNKENKYYSLATELVNDNLWQPLPPPPPFELNKAHKYISLEKYLQPSQGGKWQKKIKINADFFRSQD